MFGRKKLPPTKRYMVIDFRDQHAALNLIRGIERFLSQHQGAGHRVGLYDDRGQQTLACSCGMGQTGNAPTTDTENVIAPVLREEDIDYDASSFPSGAGKPTDGFTLAGRCSTSS